jgi:hypothetical protein
MKKLLSALLLGITLLVAPNVARADTIFATTTGGQLISFDSSAPGTILSQVPVTGVAGSLVGIDFRPAAVGTLYGVGNNAGAGTIYIIDTSTGVASVVAPITVPLVGTIFGVDFNPVPDALRITSNAGQNLRIAGFPTGTFATNVDGDLNISGVLAAGVVASAYTNSFAGTTSTTLFSLRDTPAGPPDQIFMQIPPNDGSLINPVDLAINLGLAGFDITFDNRAFLSWNGGAQFGTLDLNTGQAVNVGAVGGGFAGQITGISIQNIPEPGSLALLALGAVGVAGFVRLGRLAKRPR